MKNYAIIFYFSFRFSQFFSENQEFVKPVIIHRAILGSVERMIAILTESYAGKWPFWLSPRQAITIPVAPAHNDYATEVFKINFFLINYQKKKNSIFTSY